MTKKTANNIVAFSKQKQVWKLCKMHKVSIKHKAHDRQFCMMVIQKFCRPTQLSKRYLDHILSFSIIMSCNWNAVCPTFLQSLIFVVEKFLIAVRWVFHKVLYTTFNPFAFLDEHFLTVQNLGWAVTPLPLQAPMPEATGWMVSLQFITCDCVPIIQRFNSPKVYILQHAFSP